MNAPTKHKSLFTPLVSVGITSYDKPNFLELTLKNILSQTYQNMDIIVALDAPPDERTIHIAKHYAGLDSRIRLFIHPKNKGSDANTRFVLDKAQGELFFWADEDDLRDMDWVEKLVHPLQDVDVMASISMVQNIDQNGNYLSKFSDVSYQGGKFIRTAKCFLSLERRGKCNLIYGIFRTENLRHVRHWTEFACNKYFFGDNVFVLSQVAEGTIIQIRDVSFYKRIHHYSPADLKLMPSWPIRTFHFLHYSWECIWSVKCKKLRAILLILLPVKMGMLFLDSLGQKIKPKLSKFS